ncbi:hypothetical protein [Clavibacter zhangzhiyongii]|uniref:hypothetical protein n=1 Tax=Clavibacter zhangzhiyongii TaxID=2768071 RepID=UPI0039E1C026
MADALIEATGRDEALLLQRVIFPTDHDPDTVPLYVDADYWTSIPVVDRRKHGTNMQVIDADHDRARSSGCPTSAS